MLSCTQFVEIIGLTNFKLKKSDKYTEESWSDKFDTLSQISNLPFPEDPVAAYGESIWRSVQETEDQFAQERLRFKQQNKDNNLRAKPPRVSYLVASEIARIANITSLRQWFDVYSKCFKPLKLAIPAYPGKIYEEWENWGVFLGTNRPATHQARKVWVSYEEAKQIVRDWRVTTAREYQEFVGTHFANDRLPIRPDCAYEGEGWTSWTDFLTPRHVDYQTAKDLMKPLGLRTEADFRKLGKEGRPAGVPAAPYNFYGDEFESWADFLGYEGTVDYAKRKNR